MQKRRFFIVAGLDPRRMGAIMTRVTLALTSCKVRECIWEE
jgi:hypothetical protein